MWIRKGAISSLLSLYNENGTCETKQTSQAKLNVLESIQFRNNLKCLTTGHGCAVIMPEFLFSLL